ncbi:hypothetical protein BD413DRAFT_598846 [Trametes elegans]|nr:hypothetical protein BD413DRAFT_598846 [Trametes elegans]
MPFGPTGVAATLASETTRSTPATLQVPGITRSNTSPSSPTGNFVSARTTALVADINDGRTWSVVEQIRSVCLKGTFSVCAEVLSRPLSLVL